MTQYTGEIISLFVALSWTATALFADIASHRIGALPLNLIRMVLSLLMLGALLWVTVGNPYPVYADASTFFGPFIGVSLSLMAVQYAEAGIASTLMALTPVLIIVPYAIINHQRITFKEVFGTLVTIAGVAMFFLLG